MYIADLMLGEEPWINSSTVCQFDPPRKTMERQKLRAQARDFTKSSDSVPRSQPAKKDVSKLLDSIPGSQSLEGYSGVYGNFAHGNITISANETSGTLFMEYGPLSQWDLFPLADEGHFEAKGRGITWMIDIIPVTFSKSVSSMKEYDLLRVPYESNSVPEFRRGLKMSDAPPPPSLTCDEYTGNGGISNTRPSSQSISYMIAMSISILSFLDRSLYNS